FRVILAYDVVDDPFRHGRENDHRQRAENRTTQRSRGHPRIPLQISKNAPDRFHCAFNLNARVTTSRWARTGRAAASDECWPAPLTLCLPIKMRRVKPAGAMKTQSGTFALKLVILAANAVTSIVLFSACKKSLILPTNERPILIIFDAAGVKSTKT